MCMWVVESCKIVLKGRRFLFTSANTCCKMYRLATMYSITDGRTDGQTDRLHCTEYDRLKTAVVSVGSSAGRVMSGGSVCL